MGATPGATQTLTQDEALRLAFPDATEVERRTAYLDDENAIEETQENAKKKLRGHFERADEQLEACLTRRQASARDSARHLPEGVVEKMAGPYARARELAQWVEGLGAKARAEGTS